MSDEVGSFSFAKTKFTTLFHSRVFYEKALDENTLIALMKSKSSIDHNWYKIEDLLERNPSLENLYEQLWGKLNSRSKKKELKKLGIKGHYFAITGNTIITSGKSKKEVESKVKSMVDKQMIDSIYYFKL